MDKNITISGSHIRLRPMTEEDLSLKVVWYNDPDIRKTLILDEILEFEKTVQWFESIRDCHSRCDLTIETDSGVPIGLITAT